MNEYGKQVKKTMDTYMNNPDSIDKEISDIQNATHGVDVRGALAAGVKKSFDKSVGAETTSNNAQEQVGNIQNQVDQLVIEGDSSVEAAQARVDSEGNTYNTLKERLDEKETEFSSQLAQNTQEIGDKSNLPEWLQVSLREVSEIYYKWLIDHGINLTAPPYNAQSSDTFDNTEIFQQAISENPRGSIFYLPKGVYKANISINKGIKLVGANRYSTVIEPFILDGSNIIEIIGDGSETIQEGMLANLTIKGDGVGVGAPNAQTGHGLYLEQCYAWTFNDIEARHCGGHGVKVQGMSYTLRFNNCKFRMNQLDGFCAVGSNNKQINAVYLLECSSNHNGNNAYTLFGTSVGLDKCSAEGNGNYGVAIDGFAGEEGNESGFAQGITITNCYIERNPKGSLLVRGRATSPSRVIDGLKVEGNYIYHQNVNLNNYYPDPSYWSDYAVIFDGDAYQPSNNWLRNFVWLANKVEQQRENGAAVNFNRTIPPQSIVQNPPNNYYTRKYINKEQNPFRVTLNDGWGGEILYSLTSDGSVWLRGEVTVPSTGIGQTVSSSNLREGFLPEHTYLMIPMYNTNKNMQVYFIGISRGGAFVTRNINGEVSVGDSLNFNFVYRPRSDDTYAN